MDKKPEKQPTETDYLIDDILGVAGETDLLETDHMPAGRKHTRISPRRRFERVRQKESLLDIIPEPPGPGESIHIIGTGEYDFWTFVPQMIDWIGYAAHLTCSTWTLNRQNAIEFLELWDAGKIGMADFLTGLYFKRRETAVYTMLLEGIRARGGRYRAFRNHAKVLLLENPDRDAWITVEGSANLTANPRLEQYVMTNDRALYDFHRTWTEEALTT